MKSRVRWTDIAAFQAWSYGRPVVWLASVPGGAAMAMLFATTPDVSARGPWVFAFVVLAGFSVGIIGTLIFSLPVTVFLAAVQAMVIGELGEKEFHANGEGFSETGSRGSRFVAWTAVKGVWRTRRHVFLRMTMFKYALVSRRSFAGEREFLHYYANLIALWADSRGRN